MLFTRCFSRSFLVAYACGVPIRRGVFGWAGIAHPRLVWVVGLPELSVEAARQWGVELSRLVLVPDPGTGSRR